MFIYTRGTVNRKEPPQVSALMPVISLIRPAIMPPNMPPMSNKVERSAEDLAPTLSPAFKLSFKWLIVY